MRLFFAINFSDNIKARLAHLRDDVRSRALRGNFTATENFHLTLAFLGECSAQQISAAKAVSDSLTPASLDIRFNRLGRFRRDGGDIFWVGIVENKALLMLHNDLIKKLVSAGFRLDNRKYSPHITLARAVVTEDEPRDIEPFGETVRSVELMKSERLMGKLTYTAI